MGVATVNLDLFLVFVTPDASNVGLNGNDEIALVPETKLLLSNTPSTFTHTLHVFFHVFFHVYKLLEQKQRVFIE